MQAVNVDGNSTEAPAADADSTEREDLDITDRENLDGTDREDLDGTDREDFDGTDRRDATPLAQVAGCGEILVDTCYSVATSITNEITNSPPVCLATAAAAGGLFQAMLMILLVDCWFDDAGGGWELGLGALYRCIALVTP